MTFEEIEQLAKNGEALRARSQPEEWLCWKAMSGLYRQYRARQIDRDTAKSEKQEIIRYYQQAKQNHDQQKAVYARYQDNIRTGEKYNYEIKSAIWSRAEPLEVTRLCLKLYGALTGDDTVANAYLKKLEDNHDGK